MRRAVVVAALALVAACSSSSPRAATTTSSRSTTSTQPSGPAPTVTTTTTAAVDLPGIGTTDAAWNAKHKADSRFTPGSAYDPDPNLVSGKARYVVVIHQNGRIFGFQLNLPPGTDENGAVTRALQELPADTTIDHGTDKAFPTCKLLFAHSATLDSVLGNNDDVVLMIETGPTEAYTPSSISDVSFVLSGPDHSEQNC